VTTLSTLCVECGLCCDGSLFRFVPAEAAERASWETLGLPLVTQSGRLAMALPCQRLEGRCCTVYQQRPSGCRAYVCHLGTKLDRGEVDFEQALSIVREAQRRIAELRRVWPLEGPIVQQATALALSNQEPSAQALEALEAVQHWLDSHVHWPEPA
jgi:uncharacterized protein